MIKIKSIGSADGAGFQSMGNDRMCEVSQRTARKLCGMYPMPAMGYETVVAVKHDHLIWLRLVVQNVSGKYFLCSANVLINQWGTVFGVEVQP